VRNVKGETSKKLNDGKAVVVTWLSGDWQLVGLSVSSLLYVSKSDASRSLVRLGRGGRWKVLQPACRSVCQSVSGS